MPSVLTRDDTQNDGSTRLGTKNRLSGRDAVATIGVWVLAGAALLFAVLAWVQAPRVGYVDTSVLLQQYSGAQEARAAFEQRSQEWQGNVQTLQAELGELNARLTNDAGRLGPDNTATLQDSIRTKERELARYAQAVSGRRAELEQSLMEPVLAELNARIQDFGSEEGYDLVLGTLAGGNILYADERHDLTEELLTYLDPK